jgi:hypothetical protein
MEVSVQRHKTLCSILAAIVFLVIATGPALASHKPKLKCYSVPFFSKQLLGNALGDPPFRTIRTCVPKSYHEKNSDGSFKVKQYPAITAHPGMGMPDFQKTIVTFMEHREPGLGIMNPSWPAKFGDYELPIDEMLYAAQQDPAIGEFIWIEIPTVASNGSTWGLCSEPCGNFRGYIREAVNWVQSWPRVKKGRDNLFTIGYSTGAYVSWDQAVTQLGPDGKSFYGGVAMMSPAGSNYATAGPVPGEPLRATLARGFVDWYPMLDVPTTRPYTLEESRRYWGDFPTTWPGGGGKFFSTAWNTTDVIGMFDPTSPWAPERPWTKGYFADMRDQHSAFIPANFQGVQKLDMRQGFFVEGVGGNLAQTALVVTAETNLDQNGQLEIPFHPKVPDQPALKAFLNIFAAQVKGYEWYDRRGDHISNLNYPGEENTLKLVLRRLFALRGSKNGNPLVWNSTRANASAACEAKFPHHGTW